MGGLAVVSTEVGEARRIDRQLFGRCGRQGASGSYEQILSLEDPIFNVQQRRWLFWLLRNEISSSLLSRLLPRFAQRAEERRAALARKRLLESEKILRELLAFSGASH